MDRLRRTLSSVESLEQVDPAADAVQRWLRRVPLDRAWARVLRGSSLGHPVHPALVLLPIGAWMSAGVLDMFPGQQQAARRLVLTGLLATAPAVAAGAADLRDLGQQQRRVGVVHAMTNIAAAGCYLASYRCRRRGRTGAGRVWSGLGLAAIAVGGTLGGHLAYAQGAGVFRWQPERRAA